MPELALGGAVRPPPEDTDPVASRFAVAPDLFMKGPPTAPPVSPGGDASLPPELRELDPVANEIKRRESGGDPNIISGGGHFGFPSGVRVGAGLYQDIPSTWRTIATEVQQKYGRSLDFNNPADQEFGNRYWMVKTYGTDSKGRNLQQAIAAGEVDKSRLAGQWISLAPQDPGAALAERVRQGYITQAGGLSKIANEAISRLGKMDADLGESMKRVREALDKTEQSQEAALKASQQPPQQPVQDAMQKMGGLATVVGILGGLLTKAPMRASINAGAAAIEAYNRNDLQTYQIQYGNWKTQTDMLFKLAAMQADHARDILANEKLGMDEKRTQLDIFLRAAGLERLADAARTNGDKVVLDWYEKNDAAQRQERIRMEQIELHHEEVMSRLQGSGGGYAVSKTLEVLDKNDNVVRTVLGREGKNKPGWVDSATGEPISLNEGEHLREVTPTTAGGGRAGAQIIRQQIGGREVLSDLQNAVSMPVGTTIGPLGTYNPGPSITGALSGDMARKLTDQDSQLMQASMASMTRELSILMSPVYGGNWAAQQIDPLIPKSGDTLGTVLFKLARLAQSADNALEAVAKAPVLSGEQKAFAKEMRDQIGEAIPWSPADALAFVKRGAPPEQSFGEFVKAQHITGSGAGKGQRYATPDDVLRSLDAGTITREQAKKLMIDNFGFREQ